MRTRTPALGILAALLLSVSAWAHCEIPCGIYDDEARFKMLEENITTIEKSMNQIKELSAAAEKNYNQIVRWVTNKDEHAEKFQNTVWQYFLTQRIKPVSPDSAGYDHYVAQTTNFHEMLVYAMKCMQTTDQANVDKLRELTGKARELYFKEHSH